MPAVYAPVWMPATYRGRYRHMAKRDAAVWESFLAMFAERFEAFAYDVALGGVLLTQPEMSEEEQKGWQYSTALKIDAVGQAGGRFWIIEVRPDVSVSALGAALTYALVADRESAFDGPLQPAVVCNAIQPDVKWACDKLGVEVFAVPTT